MRGDGSAAPGAGGVGPPAGLAGAGRWLPAYRRATAGLAAERRPGGVGASEMFFFFALAAPGRPGQILESGRARGQSTLVLARCFPDVPVVSVELAADSPDAAVAAERLRPCRNVELGFGDARRVLPDRLGPGDAVLIDGPKEFRALKLALRLLRTGRPGVVCLHDFGRGSPVRRFVERHWPDACFSDDPWFLRTFGGLDEEAADLPAGPTGGEGGAGSDAEVLPPTGEVGARPSAFAALRPPLPGSYAGLWLRLVWARFWSLLPEKLGWQRPASRG